MTVPDEKIVIRWEDLPAEPTPIRISEEALDPLPAILLDEPSPPAGHSERPPSPTAAAIPRGRKRAPTIFFGVAATIIGSLAIGAYSVRSNQTWTERIALAGERSVVLIELDDGVGTGFVVGSSGRRHLILTNRHVALEGKTVKVRLHSGATVSAVTAGYPKDDEIDLALLLVETAGLQRLGPIASFDSVRPGMEVAALGHPLGLDYTITEGIISAKRGGMLLQTSAPISPGNSGGPLVTRSGAIVGVNTMTIKPDVGHSLAFAVRADYIFDRHRWRFTADVDDLLDQARR